MKNSYQLLTAFFGEVFFFFGEVFFLSEKSVFEQNLSVNSIKKLENEIIITFR